LILDSNIFEGMEKFGLTPLIEKTADIFQTAPKKQEDENQKEEKAFNIDDYIYAKKFDCPVCDESFKANIVKWSKMRMKSIEYDLRPIYAPIEPMYYGVIVCDHCGYSSIMDTFNKITIRQSELVLSEISPNFKPQPFPKEPDIDTVIDRYKLALLNATVKKAKFGEKAYICMKLVWLYRIKENDAENERKFAVLAAKGFTKALETEHAPIMGLEEVTILYLIASFSNFLGDNRNSLRILSTLIVSKKASERLKDRARDLKTKIMNAKGDGVEMK